MLGGCRVLPSAICTQDCSPVLLPCDDEKPNKWSMAFQKQMPLSLYQHNYTGMYQCTTTLWSSVTVLPGNCKHQHSDYRNLPQIYAINLEDLQWSWECPWTSSQTNFAMPVWYEEQTTTGWVRLFQVSISLKFGIWGGGSGFCEHVNIVKSGKMCLFRELKKHLPHSVTLPWNPS